LSQRRRRGAWALVVVLAGLGLGVWWLRAPEVGGGPGRPMATAAPDAPAPLMSQPPEVQVQEVGGALVLRATLLGDRAFSGEARVGVAFISEEDRAEWEQLRREGPSGAGPTRLVDLANVAQWLPAPVSPEARGGGTLGPVPVPLAHRYRLLAWEPEGTFYWGDFVPEGTPRAGVLDAGELRATRPTGLRIRLTGAGSARTSGRYHLSLERVVDPVDAERASELLAVVRLMAPALASALQDEALLPLALEEELLLQPLTPDRAVRLRVRSSAGRESAPVEVPLREGRVETVVLDVARLFPEGEGGLVELRGRLLLGSSERPPPGALIERLEQPGAPAEPEPDGRFTLPGLPAWRASRFAALMPPVVSGRPLGPRRWEFELTPDARAESAEVTWRVPAYRWLMLRMDAFTRGQLALRARRPYPVFLLQRREADGSWRLHPAEEFLPEEEGVAVSLLQPGVYRVLAAASPYELYESTSVELAEGESERFVTLAVREDAAPCEVRVSSAETGQPVYGALVTATGGHGSLPPMRGHTDAEGRWELGRVRASSLYVEVRHEGHARQTRESMGDCQRSGIIDVRL
jgi:hypothetical protein